MTRKYDNAGPRPARAARHQAPTSLGATAEVASRGGARTDRITQDELRRYGQLKEDQRRLKEEADARRRILIDRLAAQVPVELGPYRVFVSMSTHQLLTATKLREILAEAEIEDLKSRVSPTDRIALHVTLGE
jgi:hypothetical protein